MIKFWWPFAIDLETVLFFLYFICIFFNKKNHYNLQSAGQILMQFYIEVNVSWFYKLSESLTFDFVSVMASGRLLFVWVIVFNSGFAQFMLAQMSHCLLMWDECCICLKQRCFVCCFASVVSPLHAVNGTPATWHVLILYYRLIMFPLICMVTTGQLCVEWNVELWTVPVQQLTICIHLSEIQSAVSMQLCVITCGLLVFIKVARWPQTWSTRVFLQT